MGKATRTTFLCLFMDSRTTLDLFYARDSYLRNDKILKSLEGVIFGHFAKAIVRQNSPEWLILGLNFKVLES